MKLHRFALGAAACALATLAQAQALRGVQAAPAPARSANTQQSATFGAPRAAGLSSAFPAGLTAGSGPATGAATTTTSGGSPVTTTVAATSPAAGQVLIQNPNMTVTATNTTSTTIDGQPIATPMVGGVAAAPTGSEVYGGGAAYTATNATNVMGAGAAGGPTLRQSGSLGAGPYSQVDVASAFLGADANGDRELTRAEATRLTLMPYSFEEMDLNRDGILTRMEYEEALRR